jgi:hypothetical protein
MDLSDPSLANIDSVVASTRQYVWRRHGLLMGSVIAVAFGVGVYLFFFVFPWGLDAGQIVTNAVYSFGLPQLLTLFLYAYFQSQVAHLFVAQVGKTLGFSYERKGDLNTVSGEFFKVGHSKRMYDVLLGTYKGKGMRIYTYRYTVGYGKTARTYTNTVYELESGTELPHVVMNLQEAPLFMSGMERVELEGNFNKRFSVDVEKGKQMEVREILQPDVMAELYDSFGGYTIEFMGNNIYVIEIGPLWHREKFLSLFKLVDTLFDKLIPELNAMAAGKKISAMPQNYQYCDILKPT